MFNLFRSRDKAVRIVLTGLLGLVGLSMVTYLIPTTGSDTGPADNPVIAHIGKDDITQRQVAKVIQAMTRNRQLPPELLGIYVPQIVQQLISERAMAYEADRLGFKVTNEETENAIMDTLPPELVKDGKVDGTTLNAVLQQQGVTMSAFKEDTARALLVARLRQLVGEGVIVSPTELAAEIHKRNDKVKVQYALLTPAKYQAEATPTDAEIKAYYDTHKATFTSAEKRTLGVILIDPAKVTAGVLPPDAELHKLYDAGRDRFRTQERVNLRHILIKSDASNDAAMKIKAELLLKSIQSGQDFATIAKGNSQDPGSAEKGGELGWIVRGQTVPEFEKAAFSLQPGQTSGLIKTVYGYHILQVEQHEQARLQPFEEVKGQLTADYMQRYTNEQVQKLADKALAELRKTPSQPEKAAEAVGATYSVVEHWQSGDAVPGIGVSKEFADGVAALRKGEFTSGPILLPGSKVALATVLDYQPAHPSSFDEAKNDAKTRATQDKLQALVSQKADELAAKANAAGKDLEKAAKAMNIEVKTSGDVDRQGAFEGIGAASSVPAPFEQPVGNLFIIPVNGGTMVGKVLSKTPADPATLTMQSASIREELRQEKIRERTALFEGGLKKRLQDQGKLKINQGNITKLVQTYSTRT